VQKGTQLPADVTGKSSGGIELTAQAEPLGTSSLKESTTGIDAKEAMAAVQVRNK
jgi:hypothetical protein